MLPQCISWGQRYTDAKTRQKVDKKMEQNCDDSEQHWERLRFLQEIKINDSVVE